MLYREVSLTVSVLEKCPKILQAGHNNIDTVGKEETTIFLLT